MERYFVTEQIQQNAREEIDVQGPAVALEEMVRGREDPTFATKWNPLIGERDEDQHGENECGAQENSRALQQVREDDQRHVKTLTSQMRRALLTARKLLQGKAIAIENDIRGLLRNFGLKVGVVGTVKFEERTRELVEGMPI